MFGAVFEKQLVFASHACEALAAVNRAILTGFERHFCFFAAVGADRGVHLSLRSRSVLASVTASLAALGLVLEAALCVEFLLTSGESELVAALFAN